MIRHIVMLRWKGDVDDAARQSVRESVETLRRVPEVRALRSGANVGRSPNAYDYAVVMDFDDMDAFARYLSSDVHQRYVQGPARSAVDSIAAIQHEW